MLVVKQITACKMIKPIIISIGGCHKMAGLNKVTVEDINVKGKQLIRCDFNVPLKDGYYNDNRITGYFTNDKKLISDGGKIILCSHLESQRMGQRYHLHQLQEII